MAMMELKAYQNAALDAVARWRDALETATREGQEAIAALEKIGARVPDSLRNHPQAAWEKLAASGGVAPRRRRPCLAHRRGRAPHPPCLPQGPHGRRQDPARGGRAGAAGAADAGSPCG